MTHDDLIRQSALALAQAEKQVVDRSLHLREMHACEYGTPLQAVNYEKLLDELLALKKLQVMHRKITLPMMDGSI